MRDFTKLAINQDVPADERFKDRPLAVNEKDLKDIGDIIMKEDKAVIMKLPPVDAEKYINVEIYFVLNDYIDWLDDTQSELHTEHECPVCAKKERAIGMIHILIGKWFLMGRKKEFEEAVRFRHEALEPGRVLN